MACHNELKMSHWYNVESVKEWSHQRLTHSLLCWEEQRRREKNPTKLKCRKNQNHIRALQQEAICFCAIERPSIHGYLCLKLLWEAANMDERVCACVCVILSMSFETPPSLCQFFPWTWRLDEIHGLVCSCLMLRNSLLLQEQTDKHHHSLTEPPAQSEAVWKVESPSGRD